MLISHILILEDKDRSEIEDLFQKRIEAKLQNRDVYLYPTINQWLELPIN